MPAWTGEGNQGGASFGQSVATAGDVNGDGYADVIVGAPYYDNGQADEGAAFVYLGGAAGLSAAAAWTAESDQAGALFGTSVGTAGDVNGDGYADVIVGAQLLRQAARPTRGGPASIWAVRPGWARRRPGRPRATRPAPSSAGRWGRRAT